MTTLSIDPFPLLAELPAPQFRPSGGSGTHDGPRTQAFAEGRRAGFEEGRFEGRERGAIEARAELSREIVELGLSLHHATNDIGIQLAELADHMSRTVIDLALEIAAAVVDHEISVADSPGRAALARAIAVAPDRAELIARLHPDDAALLADAAELAPGRSVTVVADPSIGRGGCLLDAGGSRIDAGVDTAFSRVRAALLGVDDSPPEVLA